MRLRRKKAHLRHILSRNEHCYNLLVMKLLKRLISTISFVGYFLHFSDSNKKIRSLLLLLSDISYLCRYDIFL